MDSNSNVKPGVRSSEFWMSIGAIVLTPLMPVLDQAVQNSTTSVASHNANNIWGLIGPALIASVYTIGRSLVKAAPTSAPPQVATTNVSVGAPQQ